MQPQLKYNSQPRSGTYSGFIGSGIITLFIFWVSLNYIKFNFFRDAKSYYQKQHRIIWEEVKQTSPKYTESNPLKPENLPDKTNLFSDRNQQASQEMKSKDNSDNLLPESPGKSSNLKIVQLKNLSLIHI